MLFIGCKSESEITKSCTEKWICPTENTLAYRTTDCTFKQITDCENGCENGECNELAEEPIVEPEEEQPEILVEDITEETSGDTAEELSEDASIEESLIEQLNDVAERKINSYSYRYKSPSGKQYEIYVKDNKIKLDYISDEYVIYIDTEKATAEKYCIVYSSCGKFTGKIEDLDYDTAYIKTPLDWIKEIEGAEKIDEGSYFGKQSFKLNTNIGQVVIDSNFGFIYSIEQEEKSYFFTETSLNRVQDSDVNIPEHLLPE